MKVTRGDAGETKVRARADNVCKWADIRDRLFLMQQHGRQYVVADAAAKAATTQKFPRAKLADDGTQFDPCQPIVTRSIYKAEIIAQYGQMEFDGESRHCCAQRARPEPARRALGAPPGQWLAYRRAAQSVPVALDECERARNLGNCGLRVREVPNARPKLCGIDCLLEHCAVAEDWD
jgi:hypothetical protein